MNPVTSNVLKSLFLPPGILIIIALAGIILLLRRRALGMVLVTLSILLLYVFSTPFFSSNLAAWLEPAALNPAVPGMERAEAIVVLGCGRYYDAPEYGGDDDISACSLVRLRYTLELMHRRELPLLISGGGHGHERVSEAEIMDRFLRTHTGRQALWLETDSRNTFENARMSADMLRRYGIDSILLVTDALHMQRAELAFESNRINVIPAPTYFHSRRGAGGDFLDFLPTAAALSVTHAAFREILGMLWFLYAGPDGA